MSLKSERKPDLLRILPPHTATFRFVLFSGLIISSYPQLSAGKVIIFSLKVCRLNIREVREGEILGPMGR